jgi:ubiquinone/menaquinone biosynthesis C-methylase UbiE
MPDAGQQVRERNSDFTGGIPELYHRHLGPVFFEPYARDLARRVAALVGPSGRVLEIAAGTGIVTHAFRETLPTSVEIVATDLSASMLEIAKQHVGNAEQLRFEVADATSLPYADASFDVVACQFGLMFFPDKPRAARETLRVLRLGGSWLFSVWGPFEDDPVAVIGHRAIAECFEGEDPPEFCSTPFGFHDSEMLRRLALDAGFTDVTIDDVHFIAESESAYHAAVGIVQGSPIVTKIREHGVDPVAVTEHVARALARELGDHPLRAPMMARVVECRQQSSPGRDSARGI